MTAGDLKAFCYQKVGKLEAKARRMRFKYGNKHNYKTKTHI